MTISEKVFTKFKVSMKQIVTTLKQSNNTFTRNPRISIALSGGVDSIVLLDLLLKYRERYLRGLTIHAITIDHGLRRESANEALLLNDILLTKNKLPIIHQILKINETISESQIERHARELRYKLMYQYCSSSKIPFLFMGHHLDDQMETFMIRLQSNSTLFGLMGMKMVTPANLRDTHKIDLIRPLLNIRKNEIYSYAKENQLKWFEDYTNDDVTLTRRNRIRSYLRQNEANCDTLIQLHEKTVKLMNESIYKKLNDLKHSDNFQIKSDFSERYYSKSIKIKITEGYEFTTVDYLLLDRFLYNESWTVSPSATFHYNFTKFDNKYSTIEPCNSCHSFIEDMLQSRRGKRTLSGCLFQWELDRDGYLSVEIFREPPHRNSINNATVYNIKSFPYFYDNRFFIKPLNPHVPFSYDIQPLTRSNSKKLVHEVDDLNKLIAVSAPVISSKSTSDGVALLVEAGFEVVPKREIAA